MGTRIEVHTGEIVARKGVTSRVAEAFRKHRTLCDGVLYAITIIAVLVLVARL
jgi:hypothetical protein